MSRSKLNIDSGHTFTCVAKRFVPEMDFTGKRVCLEPFLDYLPSPIAPSAMVWLQVGSVDISKEVAICDGLNVLLGTDLGLKSHSVNHLNTASAYMRKMDHYGLSNF